VQERIHGVHPPSLSSWNTGHAPRGARRVNNPALPGGAFVNQEDSFLRFATGCHSRS
jgi:hypothetical protein